jgi:hypothetical protein
MDGTALGATNIQERYTKRDAQYNKLNRAMYQTYAASAYLIHDKNFASYCRPALRNLPSSTAFKLEQLKQNLRDKMEERPPYKMVQEPRRSTTQPVFSSPRPTYADVLKPQAEWMKRQSPLMSDEEADATWRRSNELMFGREGNHQDSVSEIKQKINDLQYELYLRTEAEARAHPDSTLPFNSLAARVFYQGKRSMITEENPKRSTNQKRNTNQSQATTGFFVPPPRILPRKKPTSGKNPTQTVQSSSSDGPDTTQSDFQNQDASVDVTSSVRKKEQNTQI